ncbi:MAG: PCMD domain-containing protein [Tannerellaceae bacterium]|nr:PCMD domain-containing protein [Tannerellaceae bacterium]
MKNIIYLSLAILLVFVSGCTDERDSYGDKGNILFSVSMSDAPIQQTRASSGLPDGWNPAENCLIQLFKGDDLVESYDALSKLPSQLTLEVGEYTLKVTAGQEAEASFDVCYYEGEKIFSVTAGETETVALECKLKNTLATVEFASSLEAVLDTDSKVYITGNIGAELEWTLDNNEETGYFILSGVTALSWAFEGKVNGKNVSVANTISPANLNTNYILTFDYDESGINTPEGGLIFKLEIIEPEAKEDIIDYDPEGIEIEGDGFDLENPDPIIEGTSQEVSLSIGSASELTSLFVQVDDETKSAFGLTDSSFDFITMSEADKNAYAQKGIVFTEPVLLRSAETEVKEYALTVTAEKVQQLPVGEYVFDIHIKNEKGNSTNTKLKIIISEDPVVSTNDIIVSDVWAVRATLTATKLKDADSFSFDYRVAGEENWITVSATLADDQTTIRAEVTGLADGTVYEYRANGGTYNGDVKTFQTEVAAQLPNASFENWQAPNYSITNLKGHKDYWIFGPDEEKFWDSGNKGATTASSKSNLTTPNTNKLYIREGDTSAQLASAWVGVSVLGRFAAGNMFAGEYVDTIMDGLDASTAGGELSFGREFTSRPTKLKGWYKYVRGIIDYVEPDDNIPIPPEYALEAAVNQPDQAHIYVALSAKGSPYTIINTSAKNSIPVLFDKNDPDIIAFGELIKGESTTADGLEEFTIELDYRDPGRIPTHIVIVCSASRFGDYFTGSTESTLWLDDFELIYE